MIGDRWGVTEGEIRRRFPCDQLIPDPGFAAWRGVTVDASPADVWPWVAQIRLAPYSYDWIDNLGRRSPRRLRGLPDPVVGDRFTTAFGRPAGRVVSTTAGEHLTAQIMGTVMSYVLVPEGARTRLLLKLVARNRHHSLTPLLSVGDLVMARRQLLNLARLAEQGARYQPVAVPSP